MDRPIVDRPMRQLRFQRYLMDLELEYEQKLKAVEEDGCVHGVRIYYREVKKPNQDFSNITDNFLIFCNHDKNCEKIDFDRISDGVYGIRVFYCCAQNGCKPSQESVRHFAQVCFHEKIKALSKFDQNSAGGPSQGMVHGVRIYYRETEKKRKRRRSGQTRHSEEAIWNNLDFRRDICDEGVNIDVDEYLWDVVKRKPEGLTHGLRISYREKVRNIMKVSA